MIEEIEDYLQEIYDKTKDSYIQDTVNLCKRKMNGTGDKNRFNEIVGKLKSIEKNIDTVKSIRFNFYWDRNGTDETNYRQLKSKIDNSIIKFFMKEV